MRKLLITIICLLSCSFASAKSFQSAISIFGDSKYPSNFQHFEYVNPDAKKGGTLKLGVEGVFNSLNQFILKGVPASGISYIYDSLTEASLDEISTRYPLVAKSIYLAPDRSYIEFILNKKARFHDGKQITADDVIFTFNKLVAEGHPSYKMLFRDVENVKKLNRHHVRFNFKNGNNRDLPILVSSLSVLPKHYYDNVDFSKSSLKPPLGSGPYKIKTVKTNKSIIYERVKDYWAKDLPVNRGRYNFDKISYDYYRDANVLIEGLKAQKYDLRQENVARNWANAYNIDAVENGEIIKKEIRHFLPASMQAFVLNLRKEKFQNIALRKAMTYAFDFEWLKNHIFYGSYERTQSYFANSDFASSSKNLTLPESKGDGFNRTNLLKAKKILDKAGYKVINGKLHDPKTNKIIEIEFLIASKAFEMIIAPFVQNLRKLGIEAKMRFIEENQYQTRVNNFDYDVITAVFGQSQIPGNELFSYFHSTQKDIKGSRNLIGLSDKSVDKLVEKITRAKDKPSLINLCKRLDKRLLENYYTVPQWHNNTYRILYRDIFGFPKIQPKYSLAIDAWWVK
jgi:microcin C transport system substrate-binding protein